MTWTNPCAPAAPAPPPGLKAASPARSAQRSAGTPQPAAPPARQRAELTAPPRKAHQAQRAHLAMITIPASRSTTPPRRVASHPPAATTPGPPGTTQAIPVIKPSSHVNSYQCPGAALAPSAQQSPSASAGSGCRSDVFMKIMQSQGATVTSASGAPKCVGGYAEQNFNYPKGPAANYPTFFFKAGLCQVNGVTFCLCCLLPSRAEAAVEGDVEGVEGGLPPVGPPLAAPAGGVQAHDRHVQALECGVLGGEMAAGVHGPP